VVLALTLAVGAFALAVTVIDERFVGSQAGRDLLAFGRSDDDLEITSRVLALRGRDPGRPLVLVVGASETREIIDRERFEAALAEGRSEPVDTLILAQPRQGLAEVRRIADEIPDGTPGVFIFSLGIGRFVADEADAGNELIWPRLGFRTGRRDAQLLAAGARVPPATGLFLLDNLRFYFPRLMVSPRNVVLGPPKRRMYRYDDRPPMTAAEWDAKAKLISSRLGEFDANWADNAARVAEIIDDLRRRTRMTVVATMLPVNPRFVDEVIGDGPYRGMTGKLLAMVETAGLPLADLSRAELATGDYWDWIHLRSPEARGRTTDLIVETVRNALEPTGATP
jgi:hypothetical protein